MEDDFDPRTQPEWLSFHDVCYAAIQEFWNEWFIEDVEQRRRCRSDERLMQIEQWCQDRLAKF